VRYRFISYGSSAGEFALYLGQLFSAKPLMALALLVCLATILWCILLARRQRNGLDKILTALLGFFAVYQSLRVLRDSGFAPFTGFRRVEEWVDLVSACLYLVAAFILKTSSIDRVATKVHLRLMEAGEKAMDLTGAVMAAVPELHPVLDSSPLAILAVDIHGMVTHCNAAAENLLGWMRHELLGHPLPFDPKGPLESKSGASIEAAVWTAPIRSLNGQPSGTVIVAAGNAALRNAGLDLPAAANSGVGLNV
jgi:PAS domain-containing protein